MKFIFMFFWLQSCCQTAIPTNIWDILHDIVTNDKKTCDKMHKCDEWDCPYYFY